MSKIVVADSSCLIALSRIGKIVILHELFDDVLIPHAVYHEVVEMGEGRPGVEEIKGMPWIKLEEVQDQLAVKALMLTLGRGESEAMILLLKGTQTM